MTAVVPQRLPRGSSDGRMLLAVPSMAVYISRRYLNLERSRLRRGNLQWLLSPPKAQRTNILRDLRLERKTYSPRTRTKETNDGYISEFEV